MFSPYWITAAACLIPAAVTGTDIKDSRKEREEGRSTTDSSETGSYQSSIHSVQPGNDLIGEFNFIELCKKSFSCLLWKCFASHV